MSLAISEEIQQLQLRIVELEKQEKEKQQIEKQTSICRNFIIITDLLNEKKKNIQNNRYSKNIPLAKYYDEELVTQLEAIYNILRLFDTRLSKLETL